MAGNVAEFTDSSFGTDVLAADEPVVVDFWAPWCGPCKMIAPTIEQLANDFQGRARVGKVNTDENPQIATQHGISAIPTVMIFKGGQMVEKFVGVTPKDRLQSALERYVG